MNETSAKEWLNKAWHHLSSAKLLFEANHYTDTIAVDLHYAVELQLKSFLAYQNSKIIRTHNLIELHQLIRDVISFDDAELDLLDVATKYHIEVSYPSMDRAMPSREEIGEVIEFADKLFIRVCSILNIDKSEAMEW